MVVEGYSREFSIDRGLGTEYARWTAWMKSCPNVRGYGQTKAEARLDLASYGPRK